MAQIVLITGLMASGKSTVAQKVAESLPRAVHLRGDTFRKMIVSGREDMKEGAGEEALSQLRLRYRITALAAREYRSAGFDVIVQDNYYGEMLPYMAHLLEGMPTRIIVLCPGPGCIAERERARSKTGYAGYDIAALHAAFMRDTPRIGHWLDTSSWTVPQTVDAVLRICLARE